MSAPLRSTACAEISAASLAPSPRARRAPTPTLLLAPLLTPLLAPVFDDASCSMRTVSASTPVRMSSNSRATLSSIAATLCSRARIPPPASVIPSPPSAMPTLHAPPIGTRGASPRFTGLPRCEEPEGAAEAPVIGAWAELRSSCTGAAFFIARASPEVGSCDDFDGGGLAGQAAAWVLLLRGVLGGVVHGPPLCVVGGAGEAGTDGSLSEKGRLCVLPCLAQDGTIIKRVHVRAKTVGVGPCQFHKKSPHRQGT